MTEIWILQNLGLRHRTVKSSGLRRFLSLSVTVRIRIGRPENRLPISFVTQICPISTASETALEPTLPPIQWLPGIFSPGIKWPECQSGHSPASSAKIKECRHTFIPTYSLLACKGTSSFYFHSLYRPICTTERYSRAGTERVSRFRVSKLKSWPKDCSTD
jgi:hypothetical protein